MGGALSLAVDESTERRRQRRVPPECTPWKRDALLRPGQEVTLLNLSAGGALIASSSRMKPGTHTELQLAGALRIAIRGRIDRCRVIALDPLLYEGAMVFEHALHWNE